METISISEIKKGISYHVKDNSNRGMHAEYADNIKIGDKIIINNQFTEVVE